MFDAVARRYDITNTVLSAGRDRHWRQATRAALQVGPGDRVLDLAAGTSVSTVELAKSGAWCLAADFSIGMLHAGHQRPVPKVGADATRLPFGDGVFDAVTISFGLRNVVDFSAGLREMSRVTKPGGRLVVLAGQIGWDEAGVVPPGFVAQTAQALRNILTVLAEAGGTAENIARLTWYVTDIAAYREQARELGPVWREVMGRNYPTMSVIGVSALVEPEAMVEIEAIAIL